MSLKRRKTKKGVDRGLFARTAARVKAAPINTRSQRGGIRL